MRRRSRAKKKKAAESAALSKLLPGTCCQPTSSEGCGSTAGRDCGSSRFSISAIQLSTKPCGCCAAAMAWVSPVEGRSFCILKLYPALRGGAPYEGNLRHGRLFIAGLTLELVTAWLYFP